MQPALHPGDLVLLWRLAYGLNLGGRSILSWATPARGQLVVLRSPLDRRLAVKRVAGLAGDPISVEGGELRLAGASYPIDPSQSFHLMGLMALPEDTVFLLGDNLRMSEDSRGYGPVAVASLLGRAIGPLGRP
jgi:signal peptidase I